MVNVSPRLWLKIPETSARFPSKVSKSCLVMPPLSIPYLIVSTGSGDGMAYWFFS